MEEEEKWPPPGARLTSALWRAEGHFKRGEYFAASRALDGARGLGEDELVAALRHLAAAGYRAQTGETARAQRRSRTPGGGLRGSSRAAVASSSWRCCVPCARS